MTYYVATLSTWVLVEALDETEARTKGQLELAKLFAKRSRSTQIKVRTIRLANEEDMQMWNWQKELEASEKC